MQTHDLISSPKHFTLRRIPLETNFMSEFLSTCPKCHQKILCDTRYVNQRVNCPVCLQEIMMPNPPAPQAFTPAQPVVGGKPGVPMSVVIIGASVLILVIAALILVATGKHTVSEAPAAPVAPVTSVAPLVTVAGTNELILRESGRALGTTAFGTENGSVCEQWDYAASPNQKWNITSLGGNQYKITSIASGRALSVLSDHPADGASIGILDYVGKNHQKWILADVGNGYYRLSPVSAPGSCLDIRGNQNGSLATLQVYTSQSYQQWMFQLQ
jgi:hypothetical protein